LDAARKPFDGKVDAGNRGFLKPGAAASIWLASAVVLRYVPLMERPRPQRIRPANFHTMKRGDAMTVSDRLALRPDSDGRASVEPRYEAADRNARFMGYRNVAEFEFEGTQGEGVLVSANGCV
jgi:hypothetical protein